MPAKFKNFILGKKKDWADVNSSYVVEQNSLYRGVINIKLPMKITEYLDREVRIAKCLKTTENGH